MKLKTDKQGRIKTRRLKKIKQRKGKTWKRT